MTTDDLTSDQPAARPSDALLYLRIATVAVAIVLVAVSVIMGVQAFGSDVGASCGGG